MSEAATVGTKEEPAEQDSEDSFRPEHVAEELLRLCAEFPPSADSTPRQQDEQRGATAPCSPREFDGPYAPRRSTRSRSRVMSPDPLMFHTTIWLEHDREASAHEEPMEQIRGELSTMQANLETLRTRAGQVADLRDAHGLRRGQRTLTARLGEVEECISVQNLREFMHRITRLEAQVGGNHGGALGEAIRACHLRLDNQNVLMEEFHARIRARDWYHDLSEQESDEEIQQIVARAESQETNVENQPGVENRPFVRRRVRSHAPQHRTQRVNARAPPVLQPLDATAEIPVPDNPFKKECGGCLLSSINVGSDCSGRQPIRVSSTSDPSRCTRTLADSAATQTRLAWSGTRCGANQTHTHTHSLQYSARKGGGPR